MPRQLSTYFTFCFIERPMLMYKRTLGISPSLLYTVCMDYVLFSVFHNKQIWICISSTWYFNADTVSPLQSTITLIFPWIQVHVMCQLMSSFGRFLCMLLEHYSLYTLNKFPLFHVGLPSFVRSHLSISFSVHFIEQPSWCTHIRKTYTMGRTFSKQYSWTNTLKDYVLLSVSANTF